jgi:hypothetical protein
MRGGERRERDGETEESEEGRGKRGEAIRTFAYITDRSELIMNDAWTKYARGGERGEREEGEGGRGGTEGA